MTYAADGAEDMSVTVPGTLAAGFADLQAAQEGQIGLAIMPVGGDRPVVLGNWTTGPAWSTMKVPLAIAAVRKNSGKTNYSVSAAITASDNSAADALWDSLGTPQQAAAAVQDVLREAGDTVTTVPAKRARTDYSAFGQAEWALADQVLFASRLPCLSGSKVVVDLMDEVASSQQWGLGAEFDKAEYKGGWGPDTSGDYLVRQFGLVPTTGGKLAIALAAQPDSGTYSDGVSMVNKIAALVSEHLDEFTGGVCTP
ncbi:hypothetical protein [Nocardia paucivorans]|uniref:hypothetical protein n=1 Tax=Nocardia paucivorans TaxID=114259 RepID=UPI000303B153|nr:hypothetical protein [Nocardia paucivorans]